MDPCAIDHCRLQITFDGVLGDAVAPTKAHGWQFAGMNHSVDGHVRHAHERSDFLNRQEVHSGKVLPQLLGHLVSILVIAAGTLPGKSVALTLRAGGAKVKAVTQKFALCGFASCAPGAPKHRR